MAHPTATNDQVTDSATQASVAALGTVPGVATANLMLATSNALALAAHNATGSQGQVNQIAQATTLKGVALINAVKVPKG